MARAHMVRSHGLLMQTVGLMTRLRENTALPSAEGMGCKHRCTLKRAGAARTSHRGTTWISPAVAFTTRSQVLLWSLLL